MNDLNENMNLNNNNNTIYNTYNNLGQSKSIQEIYQK
jgi:hypothetical protein